MTDKSVKVVLVTGISGTGISEFADKCVELGNKTAPELSWIHIRFRERMRLADRTGRSLSEKDWEDTILNRRAVLANLREFVAEQVKQEIIEKRESTEKPTIVFISSHATFWYRKTLIAGIDFRLLRWLTPGMLITVVDDVVDVWTRLHDTGQERWKDVDPTEISEWREIETFFTQQFARAITPEGEPNRFFVIPKSQDPGSIVQMLIRPESKKVYRSYPITSVKKKHPDVQNKADLIGEQLERNMIVFDPLGVTDLERTKELKRKYDAWCTANGSNSNWPVIEQHLKSQTISRDHQLIDQSDAVVVFYPTLRHWRELSHIYVFDATIYGQKKGKLAKRYTLKSIRDRMVPFSSGVLDEMHYATQRGKRVYLIWPEDTDPGPFFREIYTRKFKDVEEVIKSILE